MKRFIGIFIIACFLISSALAVSLDFQDPQDFIAQIGVDEYHYNAYYNSNGYVTWVINGTWGNGYIQSSGSAWCGGEPYAYMLNAEGMPMTYAAVTWVTTSVSMSQTVGIKIRFYDTTRTKMGNDIDVAYNGSYPLPNRIEVKVQGNEARVYQNGVYRGTSGVLNQNPSYIGFGQATRWSSCTGGGTITMDDAVWGTNENRYVFGNPNGTHFLMKDILNSAASGFYRINMTNPISSPVLIYSHSMFSTYARSNPSEVSEDLELNNYGGGSYATYTINATDYAGIHEWNLSEFFNSPNPAPYGMYVTTIDGSLEMSEMIPYIGSGATIQFDKNSYAVGETATATVVVSDSYYNLATYSYHVVIQDIYGTKVYDAPISFSISPHTGTASYTWLSTDDEGVYYGLIYAKRLSDSEELLMNYDTADLTSNLVVNGYVFAATNATAISGATVNITQGVTTDSVSSYTDGNYTSTSLAFVANAPTTIVASKTGYETYTHTFTPLYAGSIQINLTLMPTSPIHSGYAVGGIARTPPYNRSIPSASITIVNGSDYNLTTTNSVGYYFWNNLTAAKQYNVSGSKSGFANSSIYSVTTTNNWTRQDVVMDGVYTLTLTVKDASTLSGIPSATILTSNGDNTTTNVLGVATITTNYTALVVTVGATGYGSRSISYVVDRDRTETIYLTPTPTAVNGTPLTYYSPWQVRIRIADFNGNPLPGTNVTANYVASTLPSTSISWLVNAFGINSDVATEMTNSGVAMAGTTDSNGGLSFTMFKSIMYSLAITNTTAGISSTKTLYPSDQEYLIRVALPGQAAYNNTLSQMANTSLPVYQLNATAYNLSVIYHDTSGLTTNVQFQVKWRNGTFLHNQSLGNPGTGMVVGNYTILNPGIGKEVIWLFNATRSGT